MESGHWPIYTLPVGEQAKVLGELLELAACYSGRHPQPESRLYADLDINGGDFLEFVVEVERRYGVDLSWVSPHDPQAQAQDPTLQSLADDVVRQRVK